MEWALTTATYRFHLLSYESVVARAKACGFDAIELWEPHLARHRPDIERAMRDDGPLPIRVLSAYSDVTSPSTSFYAWREQLREKLISCRQLGIPCMRLFTGSMASHEAEESDWVRFIERVNEAEQLAEEFGCDIVFETHPGTLLDRAASVERFLACVETFGWTRIGINFDIFHVWEFGVDPLQCLRDWYPYVKHLHLKSARGRTKQFEFMNVYHPAGRFDDLCAIKEGVYDIHPVLRHLKLMRYGGALTLEWFGQPDDQFFKDEIVYLSKPLPHEKELYA